MPELTNSNELLTVSYEQAEAVVQAHNAIIKCLASPGVDGTKTEQKYGKDFNTQHGFDSIVAQLKNPSTFRPITTLNADTDRSLIFAPPQDELESAIRIIENRRRLCEETYRAQQHNIEHIGIVDFERQFFPRQLIYGFDDSTSYAVNHQETLRNAQRNAHRTLLNEITPVNERNDTFPSITNWWHVREEIRECELMNESYRGANKSTEFCKKTPGSLLPPSGKMTLQYPVDKENESVAFLVDINACKQPIKYVFNFCVVDSFPNRNEQNQRPWLGSWLDRSKQSDLLENDPTALRRNCFTEQGQNDRTSELIHMMTTLDDIRNNQNDDNTRGEVSKTNQLFLKMQKKALIGISAVADTLENRLNAQYRQLVVIHELGIHLPLFIHSSEAGISRYDVNQQHMDRLEAEKKCHAGEANSTLAELLQGLYSFEFDTLTSDKTELAHQIIAIIENNTAETLEAELAKLTIDAETNTMNIKKARLTNGKNILDALVDLECWDFALKIATHPNMFWQHNTIKQYAYMIQKAYQKNQLAIATTLLKEKLNHINFAIETDLSLYNDQMKTVIEKAILDEHIEILHYAMNTQENFALYFFDYAIENKKYQAASFLLFPYCTRNIGDLLMRGFQKLKLPNEENEGRKELRFLLSQSKFRRKEINAVLRILSFFNAEDEILSIPNKRTPHFISELSVFIRQQKNTRNTLLDFFKDISSKDQLLEKISRDSTDFSSFIEIVLRANPNIEVLNFLLFIFPNKEPKIDLIEKLLKADRTLPIKNVLIEAHQAIHAKNPVFNKPCTSLDLKTEFELRNAAKSGDCTVLQRINDGLTQVEQLSILEKGLHLSIIYGQLEFAIKANDQIDAIFGLTKISRQNPTRIRFISGETQLKGFFATNKKLFIESRQEEKTKRKWVDKNLEILFCSREMLPSNTELFLRSLISTPTVTPSCHSPSLK